MARIAFIGTGGTFSNAGTGALEYLSYLDSGVVLPVGQVLEMMPDVSDIAEIVPVEFAALRSKAIGPAQWIDLARVVSRQCADPDVDGVIVAHGTGVLEETAYFLHLTVDAAKPVAVVGAQRPPSTASSDAQKNFVDAVHWIRDQAERDERHRWRPPDDADSRVGGVRSRAGVVVVMNQQVHSARDVAKLANHTLEAMESPAAGPLARVNADGSITVLRHPTRRHTERSEFTGPLEDDDVPRVDIVHQYAGADATAFDACVEAGAKGIVVVGFPPGTNTPAIDAAIARHARTGPVIVQASRAIRDPRVLAREGLGPVVRNSDLSPQHARILLMLALTVRPELRRDEIQRVFDEY